MRTTVTARHCMIGDELRARARELVERLGRVATRPQHASVIFAEDHGAAMVEIRLAVPRGRTHVATGSGADHRSALDVAAARVRRQLAREKSARRPRRRAPA